MAKRYTIGAVIAFILAFISFMATGFAPTMISGVSTAGSFMGFTIIGIVLLLAGRHVKQLERKIKELSKSTQ